MGRDLVSRTALVWATLLLHSCIDNALSLSYTYRNNNDLAPETSTRAPISLTVR